MSKFQEWKRWLAASPARFAVTMMLAFLLLILLASLITWKLDFLRISAAEAVVLAGSTLLVGYWAYTFTSLRLQGKSVPQVISLPGFKFLSLAIKISTVAAALTILFFTITFSAGDLDQGVTFGGKIIIHRLVCAVLFVAAATYCLYAWLFAGQKHMDWGIFIFLPVLPVSLWNTFFFWYGYVTLAAPRFEAFQWPVFAVMALPLAFMIVSFGIWLFELGRQAR